MTRPPKQRADLLLVALGLAESRARAQALILAGKVFINGMRVAKAGDLLPEGLPIEVRGQDHAGSRAGGSSLPMRWRILG
jgi:23S rRNA (cytidine1920-2'-O)/16S rRNA (cytidine1409-2'-O)-methyltransferase